MESSIRTSIHSETRIFISTSVQATGAYILHSNGELHAYIAGLPNNPTSIVSELVLTDVVAFTSSVSARSVVSPDFYGIFSGIALKSDGTVWFCIVGLRRGTSELYTYTVQVDSDVVKISENYGLKANGALFRYADSVFGERNVPISSPLFSGNEIPVRSVAQDIIDIAGNAAHLPTSRILQIGSTTMTNVQRVYRCFATTFALTTEGRLYGWGHNTHGKVGVGPVFDRASGISGHWFLHIERPRHVMDNVANMYITDDNIVYARDTSGRLWTWGGGEAAQVGAGNVVTWPSDQQHLTPRIAGYNEPRITSVNGVAIRSDGTLWVQSIDRTDRDNHIIHDIQLPVNLNQIMGSGGTVTQPPVTIPGQPTTPQLPGTDTPSSWAVAQVNSAISAGLVPQNLQSRYTQATTRAEFTALAVALYETVTGRIITARMTFNDTTDVNVQKMGALGVVTGVGDGNFAPNDTLTREQAAVMLARLSSVMERPLPPTHDRQSTFADNEQIAAWARPGVGQIQAAGIMGGVGDNQFDPTGQFTIEQSIITMLRLFELFD